MGGFLFTPSPKPAPVIVTAPAPIVAPVAETPSEPAAPASDDRADAVARNRRGLQGTITTAETGVLLPRLPAGKSLLGE